MGRKKIEIEKDDNMNDNSIERWMYYQQRYKSFNIEIENLISYSNRIIGCFTYKDGIKNVKANKNTRTEPGIIALSGDIVFNFGAEKIKRFKKNIKKLTPDTCKKLDSFYIKTIANENCALMPVTGSLNNVKGSIYFSEDEWRIAANKKTYSYSVYDRFDSFIALLSEFYEKKNVRFTLREALTFIGKSVFKHALTSENYMPLYYFLASFDSIEQYCYVFYGIEEEFVRKLINNGKNPIDSDESLNRYMDLAEEYWEKVSSGKR